MSFNFIDYDIGSENISIDFSLSSPNTMYRLRVNPGYMIIIDFGRTVLYRNYTPRNLELCRISPVPNPLKYVNILEDNSMFKYKSMYHINSPKTFSPYNVFGIVIRVKDMFPKDNKYGPDDRSIVAIRCYCYDKIYLKPNQTNVKVSIRSVKEDIEPKILYLPEIINYHKYNDYVEYSAILKSKRSYMFPVMRLDSNNRFSFKSLSGSRCEVYISDSKMYESGSGEDERLVFTGEEELDSSVAVNSYDYFYVEPDCDVKVNSKIYIDPDKFDIMRDIISYGEYVYSDNIPGINFEVTTEINQSVDVDNFDNDMYNEFDLRKNNFILKLPKGRSITVKLKVTPGKAIIAALGYVRKAHKWSSTHSHVLSAIDPKYALKLQSIMDLNMNRYVTDYRERYESMIVKNDMICIANIPFWYGHLLSITENDIYELYCIMEGISSTSVNIHIPENKFLPVVIRKYPGQYLYLSSKTNDHDIDIIVSEIDDPFDAYQFICYDMSSYSTSTRDNDGYRMALDVNLSPNTYYIIIIPHFRDETQQYVNSIPIRYKITNLGSDQTKLYSTRDILPRWMKRILSDSSIDLRNRLFETGSGCLINIPPNSTVSDSVNCQFRVIPMVMCYVVGSEVNLKVYIKDGYEGKLDFNRGVKDDGQIQYLILDKLPSSKFNIDIPSIITNVNPVVNPTQDPTKSSSIIKVNQISEGDSSSLSSIERSSIILNLITGDKKKIELDKKLIKSTYDVGWKLVEIYSYYLKDPRASDDKNIYLTATKKSLNVGSEYKFDPKKNKINIDDYGFIVYDTIRSLVESEDDFIFIYLVETNSIFYVNGHKKYCSGYKVVDRVKMNAKDLWKINTPIDIVFNLSARFSSIRTDIESYMSRFYDRDDIDLDFLLLYYSIKNDVNIISRIYECANNNSVPTFIGSLTEMPLSPIETIDQRVSLIKKIIEINYPNPYEISEDNSKNTKSITVVGIGDSLIKYFSDIKYNPYFIKDYIYTSEHAVSKYSKDFDDKSAISHPVGKYFIDYYFWYDNFGDVKKDILNRIMQLPLFYETFSHILNILTNIGPNQNLINKIKSDYVPPENLILLTRENIMPDIDYVRDKIMEPIDVKKYNRYFLTNFPPDGNKIYYDLVSISYFMEKVDKIEPIDYYYRKRCSPECGSGYSYYRARYKSYHDRLHIDLSDCECYGDRLPPGTKDQYLFSSVKSIGEGGGGLGNKNELLVKYRDFTSMIISSEKYRDVSYLTKEYSYSVMGFLYSYLSLVPEDGPHLIPTISNVDDDRYIVKIYNATSRYNSTETENILVSKIKTAKGAYNWYIESKSRQDEMYNIIKSDKNISDELIVDVAKTFCKDIDYWIGRCSNFYFRSKLIYSSSVE
ncbi:MAG: hypothetical protein QXD03_03800 [Candidatus Anstonellales archaeon]